MYEDILGKIRPSTDETLLMNNVSIRLYDSTFNEIKKYPEVVRAEYAGSFAKDTWLTGDSDLDLFLVFKRDVTDFTKISLDVGFNVINKLGGHAYTRYADHPFVEGEVDGVKVNIVPCYDSPVDDLKSDTDRTPHHTSYMNKMLIGKTDEVRLLKYFLKQTGLYGSDIKVQGFSGYSCEVLVAWYGSFQKVIEAFSKMNEGRIIGTAYKKFDTLITIIDPVDSNRNLASAFSNENIGKMILYSRKLFDGDLSLFDGKYGKIDIRRFDSVVTIKFFSPKFESPDKMWGQINRTVKALRTQVEKFGFDVFMAESNIIAPADLKDSILSIKLAFETLTLPNYEVRKGPKVFNGKACDSFIEKNGAYRKWVDSDLRINVYRPRSFSTAEKCLRFIINSGIKSGIPKDIAEHLDKQKVIIKST